MSCTKTLTNESEKKNRKRRERLVMFSQDGSVTKKRLFFVYM